METRRLEYFIRIVDAGSINRAAAGLGIAQPALSQQLAVLESELNTTLFTRSHTGVVLTDAGRRLYPRAQLILRHFEALREAESQTGSITFMAVGIPPTLGAAIGIPLAEQILTDHPEIRLQLVESSAIGLQADLEAGLLDVAVIPVIPFSANIAATPLAREEIVLVAPPHLNSPMANLQDLAALPWFLTRHANTLRSALSGWFNAAGITPRVVAEIDSLPAVLGLIERGHGVSLLPTSAVTHLVAGGRLAAWPVQPAPLSRSVYICRRCDAPEGRSFTKVEALIRDLVARNTPSSFTAFSAQEA